jgi:Thiamine pyrophosphate enzyme, N-terminal TPP binding domain
MPAQREIKAVAAVRGRRRVVDHIVERLASIGVDHIFGVDGANIEDLYDAAHLRSGIAAVLAKHEFTAGKWVRPQRGRAGRGRRDLGRRSAEPRRSPRGVTDKSGSGAGRSNIVVSSEVLRHRRGDPTAAGTLYR